MLALYPSPMNINALKSITINSNIYVGYFHYDTIKNNTEKYDI